MFTLPLLYVGGSVTTYRVGLAVPDWPQTFGINMFLYDFWNAPFGVRIEHTHRLYGAAVGLATLLLAGWFLVFEPRRWMKGLGVLAVVAVIVQGVLGGTRVTQVSTLLAAVHGVVGQAFFGLMVALCVLTGKGWHEHDVRRRPTPIICAFACSVPPGPGGGPDRPGELAAAFRNAAALVSHAVVALAVWAHALLFFWQGREATGRALAPLVPSSLAVAALASTLQIVLGIVGDGLPVTV